jgi:hypothetical protein
LGFPPVRTSRLGYQPEVFAGGLRRSQQNRDSTPRSLLWDVRKNISRTSQEVLFFRFPPDARWNPERSLVEFGIGVGEYEGVVRISRRVFQILLSETPTPQRCLEACHLHRTRLELISERKVRHRRLTDDGNVEITGRDLREREAAPTTSRIGFWRVAR